MLKRIITALLAVVMVFAAVPVNVIAEEYNAYDIYKINAINKGAVPYFNGVFRTCVRCGGTVHLYCTGVKLRSDFRNDCPIPSHNPAYEDRCLVEYVIYKTTGRCTNTACNFHDGVSGWSYETEHEHIQYHSYYDGYEEWGGCKYLN